MKISPPLTTRRTQTAHRAGGWRCRKTWSCSWGEKVKICLTAQWTKHTQIYWNDTMPTVTIATKTSANHTWYRHIVLDWTEYWKRSWETSEEEWRVDIPAGFSFFLQSPNWYTSISMSWGRTSGCDCKPNTPSTEYSSPSPHHSSWILMVLHHSSWFLIAGLVRCLTPAHHQRCSVEVLTTIRSLTWMLHYSAMMGMVTFQSTNSWWGPVQQSTEKRVRTSMWPWWSLLPPASELQLKQH